MKIELDKIQQIFNERINDPTVPLAEKAVVCAWALYQLQGLTKELEAFKERLTNLAIGQMGGGTW